jgi:hypothetical protein
MESGKEGSFRNTSARQYGQGDTLTDRLEENYKAKLKNSETDTAKRYSS